MTGTPTLANVGTTHGIIISTRVRSGKKVKTYNLRAFNLTVTNLNVNTPVPPQPTPIATPTPVVTPVPVTNSVPTISGSSPGIVNVGDAFSFTPNASDADNDTLTFSITNKPAWATFDTNTGALAGIPVESDVGATGAITISVSDNKGGSASLASFSLSVVIPVEPIVCPVTVAGEYECRVSPLGAGTEFELNNAPLGMVIQPRIGYLHWTPSAGQEGQHAVEFVRALDAQTERETITFTVQPITADAATGIYAAPNGSDSAPGTLAEPLATLLQKAANRALAGGTIYLRGGTYLNAGYDTGFALCKSGTLARITNSGAAGQPITIRPYGNKYVKLQSDVGGIAFVNAQYWRLQNIELEGTAESLTLDDSLDLWWDGTIKTAKIDGRGIAMNNAHHIDLVNCLVHSFTGAGTSNNDSSYINITDSVIENNAFYANTLGVDGAGELNLQTSLSESIANNLFRAMPQRRTIQNFNGGYNGVFSNYAVPSADTAELPDTIKQVTSVFTDPVNFNFRPSSNVPVGYGVDTAVLAQFDAKRAEFGLTPAPAPPPMVHEDYVRNIRAKVFSTWPEWKTGSPFPSDLILEDPETGYCYAYADRNDYPNAPSTGTFCP